MQIFQRMIHTCDWHLDYDPKKNKKARASLDQIQSYVSQNLTDLILLPGDVWERRQREPYFNSPNDEGLGIRTAKEYLEALSKSVKAIVIGKGNNAHDEKGSIAKLHQMMPNIYAYEDPVMLAYYDEDGEYSFMDILRVDEDVRQEMIESKTQPTGIITMIPYPTKEMLAGDKSIDQSNREFSALFDGFMDAIGIFNSKFECPKVLGFHGNVQGSRYQNGQSSLGQDIIISPLSLKRANADYYALNHIHLYQEIEWNMRYSSSLYNINWGETDQKYFIELIFEGKKLVEINPIKLTAAKPMVEVRAEFVDGKIVYDNKSVPENAEVRVRLKVAENENSLISEDMIEDVKSELGGDVRIDKDIVPVQRTARSESIMEATTLVDETAEYGKVVGVTLTKSLIKKIQEIEAENMEF